MPINKLAEEMVQHAKERVKVFEVNGLEMVHLQADHFTLKYENENITYDLMQIDQSVKSSYNRIFENEDKLEKLLKSIDSRGNDEYNRFDQVLKDVLAVNLNLENDFDK